MLKQKNGCINVDQNDAAQFIVTTMLRPEFAQDQTCSIRWRSPALLPGGQILHDFFGATANHHDLYLPIDAFGT